MTKLVKLHIKTIDNKLIIQLDWDNDRHQMIIVEKQTPEGIATALKNLAYLIYEEEFNNYI